MVTTNCETGEANYFEEKRSKERVIDIVRASSSLPFVCPITYVDNIPMLDGGIVDSIPLMRARQDGFTNNVVVLTRNHGYRKEIQGTKVPPFIYKKYRYCVKPSTAAVLSIINSWSRWNGWKPPGNRCDPSTEAGSGRPHRA